MLLAGVALYPPAALRDRIPALARLDRRLTSAIKRESAEPMPRFDPVGIRRR